MEHRQSHLVKGTESLPRGRSVQGRSPVVTLDVDVGSGADEGTDHDFVSAAAGVHEGRPPLRVLCIQVGPSVQGFSNNVNVPKLSSPAPSYAHSSFDAVDGIDAHVRNDCRHHRLFRGED